MYRKADVITHRKLALTKQLYQHGVSQASRHAASSRVLAVIAFDLATETLLRTIVTSLEPSKTPSDGFPALLQQADGTLTAASLGVLPDRANILHVHAIRNDSQHKARYPNAIEVSDTRTYTRDFLDKAMLAVWGIRLDSVTLVDLVQNPTVADFLRQAEAALDFGNLVGAAQHAAIAVGWTLEHVRGPFVGRLPGSISGIEVAQSAAHGSTADSSAVLESFKRIQETVLWTALGLEIADLMRFHQLGGRAFFTMDNKGHCVGSKGDITSDEAEFVVAFAVDLVFQVESRVGDIDKPFGSEDWF